MSWKQKLVLWLFVLGVLGVTLIPLWIALLPDRVTASKWYDYPKVDVDATVHQDGSMSVVERRTFDFQKGSFSFAFRELNHRYPGDITDVSVSDPVVGSYDDSNLSVVDDGSTVKATWYFSAEDEQRTFTIRYTARCAVYAYPDGAHLYWQFLPDDADKLTHVARVTVHLPGHGVAARPPAPCAPGAEPNAGKVGTTTPLLNGETRAWGHGPLQGNVSIPDPQTVVLDIRDLAPFRFVEASVLFPLDAVPFEGITPSGIAPDLTTVSRAAIVLRIEQRLAAEANATRRRVHAVSVAWRISAIAYPLLLVGLALVVRRRDRVPGVPKILQEPPEDIHPVDLAVLWSATHVGFPSRDAYRAQLLWLAQQHVIEIQGEGQVTAPKELRVKKFKEPDAGLDREFCDFLFADDGQGPVALSSLKAVGTRAAKLRAWSKDLMGRVRTGTVKRRSRPATILAFWAMVAMAVWSPIAAGITHRGRYAWGIAEALVGFVVIRPYIPKRIADPADRERVARWEAFRRFLLQFHTLTDAPALAVVIWERYLVYATALGVADRVIKQIQALVSPEQLPSPWVGAPSGITGVSWASSVSSAPVAAGVGVTSSSSGSSWSGSSGSFSSGGGGGGGFSGGGGGGGGGGGSGAG